MIPDLCCKRGVGRRVNLVSAHSKMDDLVVMDGGDAAHYLGAGRRVW